VRKRNNKHIRYPIRTCARANSFSNSAGSCSGRLCSRVGGNLPLFLCEGHLRADPEIRTPGREWIVADAVSLDKPVVGR
jgi:hypothetical protein